MFKKTVSLLLCWVLCSTALFAASVEKYQTYLRGLMAVKAGDVPAATAECERVVALDKTAAPAWRELAVLYWQAGRKDEAFKAADQLKELAGDSLTTQLFLGNFYTMAGDSARASSAWEQALKLDPENEMAALYLASAALQKDPREAVYYWEKYVNREPESAEGYYQLGMTHEKLGHLEDARRAYQKSVSLNPGGLEAHIALAQIYEKEDKLGAAAQEYELAANIEPDNVTIPMYLGGLYFRLKNYQAAEATFEKALALNPKDVNIHFWLGILAEERKDWPKATRHFEELRGREENTVVLTRLSYYYSIQRKYDKAITTLKRLVVTDPFNPTSHYLLGLAYFEVKKYRPAEKHFLRVTELKSDFEEVYFHLGVLYDKWDKFEKAAQMFKKVISLNPKNATALNYLGYSYVDRNMKLDEGEELIKKALELDPENGAFIDSLGWLYYKKGNYPEAEKELVLASTKIADAVVFEHLGDVCVKLNKMADAWSAYHKALEIEPSRGVKKKIKRIEKLVLPNTLQRKVLKRAVGNLLQVGSLKATLLISVELTESNFKSAGVFRYRKPEQWRVDLTGNFLAPRMVIMHDEALQVYPREFEAMLSQVGRQVLDAVNNHLNTTNIEQFDTERTQTKARGHYYHYKLDDKAMLIDTNNGTVRQYTVDKKIQVSFRKYTLEEGLYLPSEISVYLPGDKITAMLKLKNFVINAPMDEATFRNLEN